MSFNGPERHPDYWREPLFGVKFEDKLIISIYFYIGCIVIFCSRKQFFSMNAMSTISAIVLFSLGALCRLTEPEFCGLSDPVITLSSQGM